MVDLKAKPFHLNDEQITWVERTISDMSLDDKIGQLFIDHSNGECDDGYISSRVARTRCGGLRYMNLKPEEMRRHNLSYQKASKYPLLIAANIEGGGNGACKGGTKVGEEIKVAATGNPSYAYELGLIGALEAKAVGCNWAFAPIVDLQLNWRNPIISTRTWSSDVDTCIEMSRRCLKGIHDAGILATAKHFPGDGVDERDHHFSSSVNTLSTTEWDDSYGRIYKEMISDGVDAIMAGHIMLPSYQDEIRGEWKRRGIATSDQYLPASLCMELLEGLLRDRLGFNGLIVTDASHMVGMSGRMSRRDAVVGAINAGCDMVLFFNDVEEDFGYMKDAVSSGRLSLDRIEDALRRILGLKAKAGLCNGVDEKTLPDIAVIGCPRHIEVAKEVSYKSVTLAKMIEADFLPISPERHRRVLIVPVHTPEPEFAKLVAATSLGNASNSTMIGERIKYLLEKRGFSVEMFVSPLKSSDPNISPYEYKSSVEAFKSKYDLVITVAFCGSFGVVQRLSWDTPKGGFEVPWYVNEVPIVFASFASPFHLADVPQVKCLVNCYDASDYTIEAFVEKLVGESSFEGKSPVDVFCGLLDTRM